MSNAFDRINYTTKESSKLVLGDFWAWRSDDLASDYPVSAYALTYEFHLDAGGGGTKNSHLLLLKQMIHIT